jgi:hypothetical protein
MSFILKHAIRTGLNLVAVLIWCGATQVARAQAPLPPFELMEASIPQLQAALATALVTSHDLVSMYLARRAHADRIVSGDGRICEPPSPQPVKQHRYPRRARRAATQHIFDRLLPVGRIQISVQQTGPPVSKRLVEVSLRVVGAR